MMPTMPPDSHKISLKIIEAVKQHPVLYINDVKGTSIKVQEFRQKVWQRISDELGLDPVWVRLKWKNLRDTYCRILKYKNKKDKGGRRKKWIFEDHLNFLKFPYEADYQPQCVELTEEYIQEINDGGMTSEGLLEQLEDRNDEDYSEYLEVLEETTADPVLEDSSIDATPPENPQPRISRISESSPQLVQQREINSYAQQIQSKYRKIRPKKMIKIDQSAPIEISNSYRILKNPEFQADNSANNLLDSAPIIITNPPVAAMPVSITPSRGQKLKKEEDTVNSISEEKHSLVGRTSIELFFNSMSQTVKLLPLRAQVEIKMAVCRIVTEAEVRYSRSNTLKNTQQLIAPPGMIPKLVLVPCSMIDNPGNK